MANPSRFYFAWCGPNEGFSGGHAREDELIFSFELKHEEGQFAELELEVVNPHVGLLAAGRPLWAWFSWSDGSGPRPLFYGRLIGIPDDLFADVIKIRLVARPINYASQRLALAEGLKVLPYYDPIFIDDAKLNDPDVALEGYSRLWHVDRITHEVSASDIITGEDGIFTFTQSDAFYESVKMKVSGAPLLICEVQAEVGWTQCDHTGVYEMKTIPNLVEDTKTTGAGNAVGQTQGFGASVIVKMSPGQKEKPPKDQTQATISWDYKNVTPGPHEDGDLMEESGSYTDPYYGGELTKKDVKRTYADKDTGQGEEYSIKESYKDTYQYQPPTPEQQPDSGGGGGGGAEPPTPKTKADDAATAKKDVQVEVEQDRVEAMYVAMRADVQPVLVDLTENEKDLIESLSLNARDPVLIGAINASDGAYFATGRGQQSIEYMLMVARAHLLSGSRVVEVEWECRMAQVIGLSCRYNAVLYDTRLPGGAALGKIVGYTMTGDGDSGEFIGKVTINCSVGNGAPLPGMRAESDAEGRAISVMGTPSYVDEGYVALGYQYYDGQMLALPTNDVSYSPPVFQALGLQLPITEDQILLRHEYHDGLADAGIYDALQSVTRQLAAYNFSPIGTPITAPPESIFESSRLNSAANEVIAQIYADNPTWVEMEFKPTKGLRVPANYSSEVGDLVLPKHIDLSA